MPTANMLSGSLIQLRFTRDHVSRLYNDLQLQSGHDAGSENAPPTPKGQTSNRTLHLLEMRNLVSLPELYGGRPSGHHPANLLGRVGRPRRTLRRGETTLVDVLLGLLEPQTGSITLNECPLQEKLSEWRSQGPPAAEVFLIDNTPPSPSGWRMPKSTRRNYTKPFTARLSELLEQLPKGVDTFWNEVFAFLEVSANAWLSPVPSITDAACL